MEPEWPVPGRVRALMTTRATGDMSSAQGRAQLRRLLPADPVWLRQVHGIRVVDAPSTSTVETADASVSRRAGVVCAVMAADCMPVLLADRRGSVVAAAHAGWRGLCAGVIEAALDAMTVPPGEVVAWLGPAIGPRAYEVGDEVRAAFVARDGAAASAFEPTRPGHWLLDLYAVARQRLASKGVHDVHGGRYCTHSDSLRYFSFRRDRTAERMAALIWLT
jgi:YfiH family protein